MPEASIVRTDNYLDAAVVLGLKRSVCVWCALKAVQTMRDEEGRIDLAFLDQLYQRLEVALDVRRSSGDLTSR